MTQAMNILPHGMEPRNLELKLIIWQTVKKNILSHLRELYDLKKGTHNHKEILLSKKQILVFCTVVC